MARRGVAVNRDEEEEEEDDDDEDDDGENDDCVLQLAHSRSHQDPATDLSLDPLT